MSQAELFIYRGLPGSGKTTAARQLQANTGGRLVGRDHLRLLLFGGYAPGQAPESDKESRVTELQDRLVREGLRNGEKVIVDDMNLRQKYVRRLMTMAHDEGAPCSFIDLTSEPVETCVERDRKRDRSVGDDVIRDLHERFIKGREYPLPVPELAEETSDEGGRYEPPALAEPVILVDIDGTVAKMNGRSPYDMTRVLEDSPNMPVIRAVWAMEEAGVRPVFVSARHESGRADTERWLYRELGFRFPELYMRADGDGRKDNIVKRELFDKHIRDHYDVEFVLDDRQQVVDMWRRDLGLTVFQVAEGDF